MTQTVELALIGFANVVVLTLLTAWVNAAREKRAIEARRREKIEDYLRQDLVAKRVAEAADAVAQVAVKAAEVSEHTAGKLEELHEQGKKIHILVNSDMTAARTNERDTTRLLLLALRQVQALSGQRGIAMTKQDLEAITRAEERIEELDQILADRHAAQLRVEKEETEQRAKPRDTKGDQDNG